MKHTLTATLAAALITLTACGNSVEKDAAYDTAEDLAEALNTIDDYRCKNISDDHMLATEGRATVSCATMAGSIYTSDHTRQWLYERNPLEPGERRLEGPNWFMHGDQYLMEDIQEHLGGTILED